MKPTLILRAVGKPQESWQKDAATMYAERIRPFANLSVAECAEGHGGSAKPDLERTMRSEADTLLKGIPDGALTIALDEHGKKMDSPAFASLIADHADRPVAFLIGGSWGLHAGVRARADRTLSLGDMTLPHALARIVLLEQIYRALTILNNKHYHK